MRRAALWVGLAMTGCLGAPDLKDCDELPPTAFGCVDAAPMPDGAADAVADGAPATGDALADDGPVSVTDAVADGAPATEDALADDGPVSVADGTDAAAALDVAPEADGAATDAATADLGAETNDLDADAAPDGDAQ